MVADDQRSKLEDFLGDDTVGSISQDVLKKSHPLVIGPRQALQETWIPPRLVHRDREIRQVINILAPAYRGNAPSNVLIYGKTGTGKTAVVTRVLDDLKRKVPPEANLKPLIVNCRDADTDYSVLRELVNATQDPSLKPVGEKSGTHATLLRLRHAMKTSDGLAIVVLDEVDRLVKRSGDNALYSLMELNTHLKNGHVSLIGISNDLQFIEDLESRVQSRLNEQSVVFHPYTQEQLRDILRDRAKAVLIQGALEDGVIEHCATAAARDHGDARRAIALFRTAVQLAEKEGAHQVVDDHVVKAIAELELNVIGEGVRTLPVQQKVLLWTVLVEYRVKKKPLSSGMVYDAFTRVCQNLGLPTASIRTVSNYLSELEVLGIIRADLVYRGRASGRTREIVPSVPVGPTLKLVRDSEDLLSNLKDF